MEEAYGWTCGVREMNAVAGPNEGRDALDLAASGSGGEGGSPESLSCRMIRHAR